MEAKDQVGATKTEVRVMIFLILILLGPVIFLSIQVAQAVSLVGEVESRLERLEKQQAIEAEPSEPK